MTRETVVGGETFVTRERRLAEAGWRAVEPPPDLKVLAPLPPGGRVRTTEVEVLEKETQPPARFTDGTMVKAMETASSDLDLDDDKIDEEAREQLKEHGIGTAATRAAIVKDLIQKDLARRQGRNILPDPPRLHAWCASSATSTSASSPSPISPATGSTAWRRWPTGPTAAPNGTRPSRSRWPR